MKQKVLAVVLLALAAAAVAARPASAQQAFTVQLGAFMPRGEDARVAGDVLVVNRQYLLFNFSDFHGFLVNGDWSVGLGPFAELSAGLGYYQRTVPAVYADWVNDNGTEIRQDLKLRVMPATVLVKILPFGSKAGFQPYVGGGLGVYFWRYSETGDFVDLNDYSIFRDSFVQSGTTAGPVAVFGARGRVSRAALIGVEGRYQWGSAGLSQDFLGDKIDLGGFSLLATFGYRF
jgi:outer membrane protein W